MSSTSLYPYTTRPLDTRKHTTRCIVIHGGLDAATVTLPATPPTRRTFVLWSSADCSIAQGYSARLGPAGPPHGGHGRRVGCAPPTPRARVLNGCASSLPSTVHTAPSFSLNLPVLCSAAALELCVYQSNCLLLSSVARSTITIAITITVAPCVTYTAVYQRCDLHIYVHSFNRNRGLATSY